MRRLGIGVIAAAVVGVAAAWLSLQPGDESQAQLDQPPRTLVAGGPSNLFNPRVVLVSNIPSHSAVQRSVVLIWGETRAAELNLFLRPGTPPESVSWLANGRPVTNGRLDLSRKPNENHIRTVLITAKRAGRPDEGFVLIVLPPSTPQKFESWLRRERASREWIASLPPIYERLGAHNSNPEPDTCRPRQWPSLRRIDTNYHPGAAYEMRSAVRPDGSGHQATYDGSGDLLRNGVSAGSADRGSPGSGYNLLRLFRHAKLDVIPFIWAAQLDGNPVNPTRFYSNFDRPLIRQGENLESYMDVRPAYSPSHREIPPGRCLESQTP